MSEQSTPVPSQPALSQHPQSHPAQNQPSQNHPAQSQSDKKDGESLATILDATQRSQLTLLLATVVESMKTVILNSFDASVAVEASLDTVGKTEDEKPKTAPDPSATNIDTQERQRQSKEQIETGLRLPETKALKSDVLASFDEWSNKVFTRVGQVVNTPETVRRQSIAVAGDIQSIKPYQAPETTGTVTDLSDGSQLHLKDVYPPVQTGLAGLPVEKRNLILHAMLLLLLSLEQYNAYSRVLLLHLTSSLKLPRKTLEEDENTTAKGLLAAVKELSGDEETKTKVEATKESRKWKIGLASVAGAAVIGITGGLAAPLVAAGIGSVLGGIGLGATAAAGYLGTLAGSTILVGGLFGAYGGKMTGQMMEKYSQEVEDFQFIPVHSKKKTSEDPQKAVEQAVDHDHRLRVTICISGWLTEKGEVIKPWKVLGTTAEVFALKYELEALLNLGNAIRNMVTSTVWGKAKTQIIARTIFAQLNAALWPLGLLRVGRVIDNPFSIAKTRSDKAGEVLADALINRAQGERPVTLIGYSLGARVIYTCLKSLARRKAFGLVENAVLIGAPTPSDTNDWRILRSAVSGRLVNVFSENDLVLGFMYRTSSIQLGIAGLQKIISLPGVENVDVSADVDGHLRYRYLVGGILKKIGFEDVDLTAVEQEAVALKKMIEEEKDMSMEAQKRRVMNQAKMGGKTDEAAEAEAEAEQMEKQVKAETEKSMMSKFSDFFSFSSDQPKDGSRPPSSDGSKQPAKEQGIGGFFSSVYSNVVDLVKTEDVKTATVQPQRSRAGTGSSTTGVPAGGAVTAPSATTTTTASSAAPGKTATTLPTRPKPAEAAPRKSTDEEGVFGFLPKMSDFGFGSSSQKQ